MIEHHHFRQPNRDCVCAFGQFSAHKAHPAVDLDTVLRQHADKDGGASIGQRQLFCRGAGAACQRRDICKGNRCALRVFTQDHAAKPVQRVNLA